MARNKGYWMKPAVRTSAPSHLAAVIVCDRPAGGSEGDKSRPVVWSGSWIATAHARRGLWGSSSVRPIPDATALHPTLEALAPVRGALWVVSPSASTSLVLSGFLGLMLDRGAKWSGALPLPPEGDTKECPDRPFALPQTLPGATPSTSAQLAADGMIVSAFCTGGNPDIFKYHYAGKSINWVSGPQYYPSSEESIALSLGYDWPHGDVREADFLPLERHPSDRAELWLKLFQRLADFWRKVDGGPWAATPGGLAVSYVRKRLKEKSVLVHNEPDIRAIEEAALFGGRASTWCYAPVAPSWVKAADHDQLGAGRPWPVKLGPVDHYDVRAMYPNILATERFPTCKLYPYDAPSVASVRAMLDQWCVIASVKLQTDQPEYAFRAGGRVTYPVGVFRTHLTTPELRVALDRGHVLKVYRAVTYVAGKPFAPAFDELLGMRDGADAGADPVQSTFIKLLSNSFGGKMAQRQYEWQRRPKVNALVHWGEWPDKCPVTGVVKHYRSRSGLVDEKVTCEVPTRPLAACFAHLTAYGRLLMRRVRESLPARSVVSQDTDGIWVLRHVRGGRTRPRTPVESPSFQLRQDKSSALARWYGPRHYWTEAGWTLSGVHDQSRPVGATGWIDSYSQLPKWTADNMPPVWVYECDAYKSLNDIPTDGVVGADGWTVPHTVRED